MKKEKEKKGLSYDEFAENFWQDIYKSNLNTFLKGAKENLKEEDYIEHEKFAENILKLPRMNDGSLRDLFIPYWFYIRSSLPWTKIKNCLKELNIDDKNIELVVFFLKPTYIESTILPDPNRFLEIFNKSDKEICDTLNNEIKKLSRLVGGLQNLIEEDKSFKNFFPIHVTIAAMQSQINLNRAVVKYKNKEGENYLKKYGISKNLRKSPQKHKYWNYGVSRALKVLNSFCHTDNCERPCRKTHDKAIHKVAELLKILYPSIWKEDVKTIAIRIKQKDYRGLSR